MCNACEGFHRPRYVSEPITPKRNIDTIDCEPGVACPAENKPDSSESKDDSGAKSVFSGDDILIYLDLRPVYRPRIASEPSAPEGDIDATTCEPGYSCMTSKAGQQPPATPPPSSPSASGNAMPEEKRGNIFDRIFDRVSLTASAIKAYLFDK
ncbi:MAG: hypothetical protein WC956_01485 [bacterium]